MIVVPRAWATLLLAMTIALPGAGCMALDALNIRYSDAGRERVFAGSVDVTAQKASARMRDLGFVTELRKDPQTQTVRVYCSRDGAKFALVLTRDLKDGAEQTRVRLEWEGQANDQTGAKVLAALDVLAG